MQSGRQAGKYKHFRHSASIVGTAVSQVGKLALLHNPPLPQVGLFYILKDGAAYSSNAELQDYIVS
jgi:hypothetical protein